METVQIGQHVNYKGNLYIACLIKDNMVQLVSPTLAKVRVGMDKLLPTNLRPCRQTAIRGTKYLVTPQNVIISLKTQKIMQWSTDHGIRKEVLQSCH